MMVINNNLPALNAYDIVNNTSNQLQKSIQKLSTGLRINSAADDAAGLSISEKMRAQINGLDQAVRNTQDGISLIQTAEGALTETHSILQRMRELSVQAANDTYTAQDRSYIQEEMDLLRDEIDHIGNTTTFNTKKLLNGDSAVLWSSDNLNTKALVRGGLRNIDQFGQKSSSEGNYKITVAAEAGTGEVQKSDILKIKHDLDPYAVEGTNKFRGAYIEGDEANLDAVGKRSITVTVYNNTNATIANTFQEAAAFNIGLNHDVEDVEGLAKALNMALTGNENGGAITATSATDVYNKLGDTVNVSNNAGGTAWTGYNSVNFVASKGADGNLQIKTNGFGVSIKDGAADATNDLEDVFGATDNTATLRTQEHSASFTTSSIPATNTVGSNYGLSFAVGGDTGLNDFVYTTVAENETNDTIAAGIQSKIDEVYGAGNVTLTLSGTNMTLTSKIGAIRAITSASGATPAAVNTITTSATTYGDATYTNAVTSDTWSGTALETNKTSDNIETNFGKKLNGASFDIKLTDTDGVRWTAGTSQSATIALGANADLDTVDKLVNEINTKIADSTLADLVYAKNEDGKVRLVSNMKIELEDTPEANHANAGSVNAVFGTGMAEPANNTTPAYSKTKSAEVQTDNATLEDMLSLSKSTDVFAFKIKDTSADENELASIKLSGGYRATKDATTGEVTQTASEKLVNDINTQLKAANLNDFKAVYDDETGAVSIYSGTRDFKIEDDTSDTSYKGLAELLGRGTVAEAEKSETADNPLETIGMVAKGETVLRDIDKFWDSQGNFLLEDPQTITITQGDGQTAKVTLYKYDTVDDMVSKFNNAIANDLGQAKYLDETDENYKTALNSFVTFVEQPADVADGEQPGQESVQGTMLIRTVAPGSTGTINFASNNEDLINALSLNTIKKADDSKYHVTVQDAHTGVVVNNIEDEKITNNVLVGRLHQNVDVEFNAMTGITAKWDDENKQFVLQGAYDETGDMSKGEETYLHLTDNTMVFQIGANEGDDLGVNIGDMRSHALGLDKVLVTDHVSASRSIGIIDNAIDKVSTQRAKLGAYQNRLEHTAANLTTSAENLTASESRIRDTDMAKTMMDFTKLQIMLQAGNSMLAQANQLPQNVLSLIR